MRVRNAGVHCAAYPAVPVLALAAHHLAGMLCTLLCCVMLCCAALHGRAANQAFSSWLTLPIQHLPLPFLQKGDLGCRALYGAPRVQPLNDYRLIYFVKKCLDAYIVSCGGSPLLDRIRWDCACLLYFVKNVPRCIHRELLLAELVLLLAGWQFADCMAGPISACSHAQFAMATLLLPSQRHRPKTG